MSAPIPARGDVFRAIDTRLKALTPQIRIEDHIGGGVEDGTVYLPDRAMSARINLPGKVVEGSSTLIGITFVRRNFQTLLTLFRGSHSGGKTTFDQYDLTVRAC